MEEAERERNGKKFAAMSSFYGDFVQFYAAAAAG